MNALPLRILLVLEDEIEPGPIERALPAGARVRHATLAEAATSWPVLGADAAAADMLIVGCSHASDRALEVIEAAASELPKCPPVVVLHAGTPNGFLQRAFAAGADDLITLPQPPEQLAFTLEKAIARRRGSSADHDPAEMITVLGPKGGTGKTLTSCNLAVSLAASGRSPVVVDLDLQFGDVGLALGLHPRRTIYDLAVAGGSLDEGKIEDFLVRHESGALALLAPLRPDQAAAVSIPFLRTLFETLRVRHDFVIVDTPPAFTPEVIAAIDSSSQLCLVGMLDALSLKDTKIGLQTLEQMGYDPQAIMLVLNRADTSVGIGQADVERLLGRRPDVLVPSDRAIPRAITEGRAIVAAEPRSGAARAFTALGERLQARAAGAAETQREHGRRRLPLLRKDVR